MQGRSNLNLKGIDISNHQGNIDFTKVKTSGVSIIYIKATEGIGYIDPCLETNYQKAKAAGLKVGFYHYMTPVSTDDAKAEAQAFYNVIKGKQADCKYCLDIEKNDKGLSADNLSNICKVFLDEVKRLTGKDTVIYTYLYFARENLTSILSNYPLWIAQYSVNTPSDTPSWHSWAGFQYFDKGSISGIVGNVDMDEFTEDILIDDPKPSIKYQAHVQNIGWQNWVQDGAQAGTTGKSLRLEALVLNTDIPLKLEAHIQDIGWQPARVNGEVAGTVGLSKRIEAIRITPIDKSKHIQYQAHVEGMGWMDPAHEGEIAGTVGRSLRLEAIKIKFI